MAITLSENQERILRQLLARSDSQHFKQRVEIILLANQGMSNNGIERFMGICGGTVTKWRNLYAAAEQELAIIEANNHLKLWSTIEELLSTKQRGGRHPVFTDEQVADIIALSLQDPIEIGLPFSRWTSSLLRDEVIKRGIVPSISAMQITRFLRGTRSKTAKSQRSAK